MKSSLLFVAVFASSLSAVSAVSLRPININSDSAFETNGYEYQILADHLRAGTLPADAHLLGIPHDTQQWSGMQQPFNVGSQFVTMQFNDATSQFGHWSGATPVEHISDDTTTATTTTDESDSDSTNPPAADATLATSFAVGTQQGAKAPIYRQLPSQTAPAQYLPTVTNKRYIQQPIYQHRVIDQPIKQQRFIAQPVLVGRQIYQPIVRKIHDRTVVQPHVIQGTTITPHVIEQPVIQKQYRQQDTYEQGYQEQHGAEPTQTLPTTFASTPAQTAGKQSPATQSEPSA